MAKERNKNKLTSKQATTIALLLTGAVFLLFILIGILGTKFDIISIIGMSAMMSLIAFVIFSVFLNVNEKESQEEYERIKSEILQSLSKESFTRVYYIFEDKSDITDMFKQILENQECRFYAKLSKEESIILIAKNKHSEEVYNCEIKNYRYFDANFTVHEE